MGRWQRPLQKNTSSLLADRKKDTRMGKSLRGQSEIDLWTEQGPVPLPSLSISAENVLEEKHGI